MTTAYGAPDMRTPVPTVTSPVTSASVQLPSMLPADIKRKNDLLLRWKAFRGDLDQPLKELDPNAPNFNILDNRCGPIVHKGVSFLFGLPLEVRVLLSDGPTSVEGYNAAGPGDDAGTSKAQDYLNSALGDIDDFMTLLSEAALNGGVTGECFIKILDADAASGQQYPRLVVLDPSTVWVETDPDDCRMVTAFNIQYKVQSRRQYGQDVLKRQRILLVNGSGSGCGCCDNCTGSGCGCCAQCGRSDAPGNYWTMTNYQQNIQQNADDTRWQQISPAITWPWPWPPIVYCQNMTNPNEFWGAPDLTDDLIKMNDQLNLIQSNIVKLLWFYSHPYLFIDSDVGPLKITPGMAIGIGQGVTVTAIQATGDIANSRAFAADLRSDMDELSRVPAVALGRLADLPRGNISGVALELLFQPLIEKTQIKRRLYGRMIRDLCQRVLCLGGYGDGENQPVELGWPELLPNDELQQLQALLIKDQLGWSTQSIMQEVGGNYKEELVRKKQEAQDKQDAFNQGMGPAPQVTALAQQALPVPPTPPVTQSVTKADGAN